MQVQQEKKQLIKAGENQILEKYKNNLPQYMEERLNNIAIQLVAMEEVQGLSSIEINEMIRPCNLIGQPVRYTTEQLQESVLTKRKAIFEYYRKAMVEINRKIKYPPSKENFCAFAGISTSTYNTYLMSPEESKQEIMLMIDDYIRENMLTSAQVGETKEVTTIFRGKTGHGMVEATAPIVIEHRSETDLSKVNAMIETIKAGKSLKSIELDAKDYNVEN